VRKGGNTMTDDQDTLNFLFEAIAELNKKEIELTEETALVADIGLSSLEVMEFIEKIEDHFDISIPLNILPDVNTIGDLAKELKALTP
jgi:acyl carrier protein